VTPLIPTTVVGSFPQPDWLVDRERLSSQQPPRIRLREIWRVPEPFLERAQDDATRVAVLAMERAGVDILTDGEIRRESYSNRLATALDGMDAEHPGEVPGRQSGTVKVPRVVGPIRRIRPIQVQDVAFLRSVTDQPIKMTIPGPFTVAQQAVNEHYPDDEALAMDLAVAINLEVKDLFAAGADVVQLDEPWLQSRLEPARRYGVRVINRALEGVSGVTALHCCFGYAYIGRLKRETAYPFFAELNDTSVQQISIEAAQPKLDLSTLREIPDKVIILGVLDLGDPSIESPQTVAGRIRAALEYVPAERLIVAPDCGMKYVAHDVAEGKLRAMVAGARIVRSELEGG
jgi:5-methyltetrahydropteroyltriglutamate--homocysteine methyltransferase